MTIDTYKNKERIFFNNINLRGLYGMIAIDESIEMESNVAISQSSNLNNGALVNVDRDNYSFDIMFKRVDFDGNLSNFDVMWTNGPILQELTEVFQGEDLNVLMIGSKVYYVTVTGIKHTRVNRSISYITVSFESLSPYAYGAITLAQYRVDAETRTVELKNKGINDIYADVQLEFIEASTVTITNNGSSISVIGNAGDRITLYGDNADCSDYSKVSGNYKALLLTYGINILKVKSTGSVQVTFKYQEELAL